MLNLRELIDEEKVGLVAALLEAGRVIFVMLDLIVFVGLVGIILEVLDEVEAATGLFDAGIKKSESVFIFVKSMRGLVFSSLTLNLITTSFKKNKT